MSDSDVTRLSMNLSRRGQSDVLAIRAIDDVNTTDAVHRAVRIYAWLLQERETGHEVMLQNKATGQVAKVTWA